MLAVLQRGAKLGSGHQLGEKLGSDDGSSLLPLVIVRQRDEQLYGYGQRPHPVVSCSTRLSNSEGPIVKA